MPCCKDVLRCFCKEAASERWQKGTGLKRETRSLNPSLTIYWLWGLGKSLNAPMPRFPYL